MLCCQWSEEYGQTAWSYTILPKLFTHPSKALNCSNHFHGHRYIESSTRASPVVKFPQYYNSIIRVEATGNDCNPATK